MVQLIKKDFYINRKYMLFVLLYLAFVLYSKGTSASAVVFGMSIVSYGMLTRSCYSDDKDRGDLFLRTLPIKPSTIVLSKYALGIVTLIITMAFFGLFAFVDDYTVEILSINIGISILTISLVYAIYLPVFFKYGYMKARTFQTMFFVSIMAMSFGLKSLINAVKSSISISKGYWLIRPLTNMVIIFSEQPLLLLLTAMLISLIMLVISICLSCFLQVKIPHFCKTFSPGTGGEFFI